MHLLINLAVIRLSLQIVIPGIMIAFKRQKERHQHHSLLPHIPAKELIACDGWHRRRGKGYGSVCIPTRGRAYLTLLWAWVLVKDSIHFHIQFSGLTLYLRQRNNIDIIASC